MTSLDVIENGINRLIDIEDFINEIEKLTIDIIEENP